MMNETEYLKFFIGVEFMATGLKQLFQILS
jgi:hypothetical protein